MCLGRALLGAAFITGGLAHFAFTTLFVSIVPDYLPAHRALVMVSGAAEIAGGAALLLPRTQTTAAWGLTALLVAVFPANLWMAQHPERYTFAPGWLLWLRVPLQIPLICWALAYTRRQLQ
jgi:uncharacterized membrane protein